MIAYTKAMQLAEELMQVHNGHSDEGPTTFSEAAVELRNLQSQRDELLSLLKEVAGNFTRDDDLPDNLLPRIDATIDKV